MIRTLILVQKLGRVSSGFQKDQGIIIHGLLTDRPEESISYGVALCGATPGKRSVGWGKPFSQKEITCEKCKIRSN